MLTRSVIIAWVSWAGVLPAAAGRAETASTRPQAIPAPVLAERSSHWGYAYRHYRHQATAEFKGPNVDQGFYDFLVRLPLLKSLINPSSKPPMVVLLHGRNSDFDRRERRWADHVVLIPDDNTIGLGHTGWFGYHELAPASPKPDTVVVPYTEWRLCYTIRFVAERYHIDPNRIWITGASMGGGGALLFALRHPEWVTGAVATCPPIDMRALPLLAPMTEKLFGPRKWALKVAGTDVSAWELTSGTCLLSRRPACRSWLQIWHGRRDHVVPFEQYFTSMTPPGKSFLQLFEQGLVAGTFAWDMGGHGRSDPFGAWRPSFNPLAKGTIRMDLPVFAFAQPSPGHFGAPKQHGVWQAGQRPERDPRGMINAFCRWDGAAVVDRPERLEVSLWLADDGAAWQRCPVEQMTCSVSPRGTMRFPVVPGGVFRYRVDPDGPRGRVAADAQGVVTFEKIPLRRGRGNAVKLCVEHAMSLPVVSLSVPTHPTPVPRASSAVMAQWLVANSTPDDPMPVDRFRCWIVRDPRGAPPADCETSEAERVFESLEPGCYHVMVQARLVTGRWGPVTSREVNVAPSISSD